MKKTVKKILAVTLAATMMMGALAGCGSKAEEKNEDTSANTEVDSNVSVESEEGKGYTLSEYFAKKQRVWIYLEDPMSSVIDKNMQVNGIFVTNPDGTLIYTYGGSKAGLKTVGEYSQMTDEEIIASVEGNIIDTSVENGLASEDINGKIAEYVKTNKYKYSFNLVTDHTGNAVVSEDFVYQTYPSIISYSQGDGEAMEYNPDYAMAYNCLEWMITSEDNKEYIDAEKDNYKYTYNYGLAAKSISFNSINSIEKAAIYESNYLVMKTGSDDYSSLMITRCDENDGTVINYDSIGTEGIEIDKSADELFEQQVIISEVVDSFMDKTGDVQAGLENDSIEVKYLYEIEIIDTIINGELVDKKTFEDAAKRQFENGRLDEEIYNDLVAKGYVGSQE